MNREIDSSIRLLLVEADDDDAANVASDQASGLSVERAVRLDDAIERIRRGSFDVILTNLALPDSEGLEVLAQLRETAPECPILLFSSSVDDEIRSGAKRLGVHEVIAKPSVGHNTITADLASAITRVLDERRFRAIVAASADALVVIDGRGDVVYANEAAGELFAVPASALVGRPFHFRLGGAGIEEIEIPREAGETRLAEMRISNFRWNRGPAFVATIRDVTEQRRSEELSRTLVEADRAAALGQLASSVAHDINNPCAVLQSNLSVLASEVASLEAAIDELRAAALDAKASPAIEAILAGANSRLGTVTEICDDTIAASKRISDSMRELRAIAQVGSYEFERCDPNSLVRAACRLVDAGMRIKASLHFDLGMTPQVSVSKARIVSALVSILGRAAKDVGGERGGAIHIVSRYSEGAVEIVVRNTGPGLSAEGRARLLDPIFVGGRVSQCGELSLAAETIRRHKGEFLIESEVGVGVCVTVRIPLASEVTGAERARRGSILTRASYRILLIDDEDMLRRAMRRVLEPPHTVTEAASGEKALELLRGSNDYDVIFCDLAMPRVSGPMVFEALKAEFPHLAERVVFISGGSVDPNVVSWLREAEPILLEKPVTRDLLLAMVDRIGSVEAADEFSREGSNG